MVHAADCVGAPTPGRRLLLLGDTCDSSAVLRLEAGRGFATVVHESTFDDASAALAAPRGHSTARMAGAFAAAAGASVLVLTHFSQVLRGRGLPLCINN
jgi:ribonuclease Z